MKVFKKISLSLAVAALSLAPVWAFIHPELPIEPDTLIGQQQEFVKNLNKNYAVGKNATVILSNKYGNVDVRVGGTNQVVMQIRVTVVANSVQDANKVLDRIDVAFADGPEFVKAETVVETQNSLISDGKSCDFRIDYDITMPAHVKLDLTNRHGNSRVGMMTSAVKIDQRYGDFKLDGAAALNLYLAYGGGQVGSNIASLTGSVNYGKLTTPSVTDVKLRTKSSGFKFDRIETAILQSTYDDYTINNIRVLQLDSKYGDLSLGSVGNANIKSLSTDFNIKRIENSADFQTQNGGVRIGAMKNGFDLVNIKSANTNYFMVIDPSVSYQLDAVGQNSDMPRPASIKTSVDQNSNAQRAVMGTVGNSNTKSVIRVRLSYGNFRIK